MKVENFIKEFNMKKDDENKMNFIKRMFDNYYVPYNEKNDLCNKIVEFSCYKKVDINGDERKIVSFNSPAKYILFITSIIEKYTVIEFTENRLAEYDLLNKNGLIATIVSLIPESEYSEFTTILNMCIDDLRDNEYSLTSIIYNNILSSTSSLNVLIDVVKGMFENGEREDRK